MSGERRAILKRAEKTLARKAAEPKVANTPVEVENVKLRELLCYLNLYTSYHTWTKLTTEQKELFANVIDEDRFEEYGEEDVHPVERWWRD